MTGGFFPPTRASVVDALRSGGAAERERALGTLVAAYWRPVYRHVRQKWGKGHEEAADLTQDFFAELLARDLLARYDAGKARLRTYLRLCVDGLAANAAKAASRQKRGGGATPLSLDFAGAREDLERAAPAAGEDPERAFEREWARSVLALALERLPSSLEGRGKGIAFELFELCELGAEAEVPSYAELAARFGVSVSDVTNGLSLARRELRRIVLDLLRELTGSEEELRLEARALLGIDAP